MKVIEKIIFFKPNPTSYFLVFVINILSTSKDWIWRLNNAIMHTTEAVVQKCSVRKMFLEVSQNLQENTCAKVSFFIKLQAWDLQLY